MSIVRAARKSQFYVLPTTVIEDDRLSWEARGMLIYLLSKPDNWSVQMTDLKNRTKNAIGKSSGRDKIYAIINELRAAGYVYREFIRSGGSFVGAHYEVSETPDLEAAAEYLRELEEKANPPFPDLPETVAPITDSAETALPCTANPEALDSTERATRIEKAVKNTQDQIPATKATASAGQPANYPTNPASKSYTAWHAYACSYLDRYKQWPLYNRTVAGQICKVVDRVGDQAPCVAKYYVDRENAAFVTDKCHPVALLLKDCEGYATKAAQALKSKKRSEQVEAVVSTAAQAVYASPAPEPSPGIKPAAMAGQKALQAMKSRVGLARTAVAGGAQ